MIRLADPRTVALVFLAAGRGLRLGGGKLGLELSGQPLGLHAAGTLARIPFLAHVAICSRSTPSLSPLGYVEVQLFPEGAPLSRSIAQGMAAIECYGADAVMITLADMPFVPIGHFEAMLAAFDGGKLATLADHPQPPVLFGKRHFDALSRLKGDRGAAHLLHKAPVIPLSPDLARDVDTAEDLVAARRYQSKYLPPGHWLKD